MPDVHRQHRSSYYTIEDGLHGTHLLYDFCINLTPMMK